MIAFWRSTTWLPRVALILALISAATLFGATFGLSPVDEVADLAPIHLGVMLLMFMLFARVIEHHSLAHKLPGVPLNSTRVPVWLTFATVGAIVWMVVVAIAQVRTYGEGGPEERSGLYFWVREGLQEREITANEFHAFDVGMLRVFASSWLFFSLLVAWAGHIVDSRVMQFRKLSADLRPNQRMQQPRAR